MRVISGIYKGRQLEGHELKNTRPTMERVKESLFAMLQNEIKESTVLDLFAGSGNLGIEALSEGAKKAYFVDSNKDAIKTIKKNLEALSCKDQTVLWMDYKKALKELEGTKFNMIFLDPPYQTNYIEESIKDIKRYQLLEKKGKIICESDQPDKIIYPDSYHPVKEKKYGDKYIVILEEI